MIDIGPIVVGETRGEYADLREFIATRPDVLRRPWWVMVVMGEGGETTASVGLPRDQAAAMGRALMHAMAWYDPATAGLFLAGVLAAADRYLTGEVPDDGQPVRPVRRVPRRRECASPAQGGMPGVGAAGRKEDGKL